MFYTRLELFSFQVLELQYQSKHQAYVQLSDSLERLHLLLAYKKRLKLIFQMSSPLKEQLKTSVLSMMLKADLLFIAFHLKKRR